VHIERALKDRNEALRRADVLKNDFIQHVSYELRSPLTNIIGFTEMLQLPSTGPLTERQGDYLDHIANSSASLLTTVNDILDLAIVDAGIMDLDISDVDVQALFASIDKQFAARLAESGLDMAIGVAPDATALKGDAQRLRQIIANLVSNAVAHGPQGSTIMLSARREGRDVVFGVHDEGPGIPKEALAQVFDRFVALPSGGRRGGAGLGLSIVKGLVELHRGTVTIRSGNGEGTLVECRIPADPDVLREAAE
jgi:signal transduction histidine kinase